jgi:hypothetical protein
MLNGEGEFRIRGSREADGSIIQPTDRARDNIAHMMRQDRMAETEIEEALRRFDEALENTRVAVGGQYEIIKWSITNVRPALDAPSVADVVPVKIAYEYLALHLGTAVLDQRFDPVRELLRSEVSSGPFHVERLVSLPYAPFHGIVLEKNAFPAVVQIRLFGGVVFRVHFEGLGIGGVRLKYTHDLERGKDAVTIVASTQDSYNS